MERILEAFFILNEEWRLVYLNSEAERVLLRSREELLGKNFWEEFPEAVGSTFYRESHRAIAERVAVHFEEYFPPLETWFEVKAHPSEIGLLVHLRDVTERKRAEEALEEANCQKELILNSFGEGIWGIDAQGNTTFINPAASRMLGYEPEELVGRPMHETVHHSYPDGTYYPVEECPIYAAFKDGDVHSSSDEVFWCKDGTAVPVEYTSTPIWENGHLVGAVVAFRDLTERKRAEEALKESEQRFKQLFENSIDALFVIHDETREIVDCNLEACRSLGYSREELLTLRLEDFASELISEDEKERRGPDTPWRRALAGEPGTIIGFHENVHRRKDGTTFPVEVGVGSIDYGGRRMILASCRDVTQRKVLEDELAYRAFHDPLTGLPNRDLFLDHLGRALDYVRQRGSLVAVLFLDLDDFKVVNDSLRHEVGDKLLIAVSQRLKGCLRSGAIAARMGGDEFTVLLEGISSVGDAEEVAERIIRELRAPVTVEGHVIFITASIGIALSDTAGGGPGDLLRAADIALYRAKDKEKARYEVFDRAKDAHALKRLELENDLRQAIECGELRVHYQPVFSLVTDHIAGVEALLRWQHPERGILSPAEFIPLAEETGLIVPVGQWVLEEACRQAREWQERFPSDPSPIMGVNLSLRQFQHRGLAEDVARVLRETGLDPTNLALEITESVAMHDEGSTVATLEELKSLGVWLVIDDFGTGNSSLSYLTSRFKMNHLKIDGSFVREFAEDPDNSMIMPGLIAFAHAMGLKVIAEGVETADQLRRLKEMGCEFVQGNHIAEPLTPAAASELLSLFGNRNSTELYD